MKPNKQNIMNALNNCLLAKERKAHKLAEDWAGALVRMLGCSGILYKELEFDNDKVLEIWGKYEKEVEGIFK